MKQEVVLYAAENKINELNNLLTSRTIVNIKAMVGSSLAFMVAAIHTKAKAFNQLVLLPDKQQAAYFYNDLEVLLDDDKQDYTKKQVLFYPADSQALVKEYAANTNISLRLETLNRLNKGEHLLVVSYPEAVCQKVADKQELNSKSTTITSGEEIDLDNLIDILDEYHFERVDFVTQAGQYAIRGGIVDVFSFSMQKPCRIELYEDKISSLRVFDILSQMSIKAIDKFSIVPNLEQENLNNSIEEQNKTDKQESFFDYFDNNTILWANNLLIAMERVAKMTDMLLDKKALEDKLLRFTPFVEIGMNYFQREYKKFYYSSSEQPAFNKNFDFFAKDLEQLTLQGYKNYFSVSDDKQQKRIENILEAYRQKGLYLQVDYLPYCLSFGFIDHEIKRSFFTDHQLFNRYHKYIIQDGKQEAEQITLENLVTLKPGDYVVHSDYGIGKFGGLEKINNNGHVQETIRLIYKNNDILYVSIHSLHKISRYAGQDTQDVKLNKLGSSAWQTLKNKTKKRVKDIAKDLIALYAKRKASKGYAFSADSYLQNELEASFMYEDTVDQDKATKSIKHDMEMPYPMDRLVCGDVGFGKTEVAIRAAFKAVCDSKQVAVLVPTTILAFQHYKTFSERLKNMPVRVDYLNRFRSAKERTQILKDLQAGKIDILIGTHRIVSKDVKFKDLGLLIIDEEQKFGVSIKEKLKLLKVNVDTLTLTATPIPRTLQFSLMGARDLSIISTPPANRLPIETKVCKFDKELIKQALTDELSRGGQAFVVHNRVEDIYNLASLLQNLVPKANIVVGHGQMDGDELEKVMMDFINEKYDILVCTTIIENGLDISNANTIIIDDAQNYGLSELHQLRGRVGRSNTKSYCYLLIPSKETLTPQAYQRLQAIEEFSSIGSGFAIAMRDLDIRGAGNILGAEQSGFISEVGYELYNKILAEAIEELKEDEFKGLFDEQQNDTFLKKECAIETDLEVLIPDYYITNITQRFKIYKELDSMNSEQELSALIKELEDRFGKIPQQTLDMFDLVRMRSLCVRNNIDKLTLKRSKMILNFKDLNGQDNEFEHLMSFVSSHPSRTQLKEDKDCLQLIITNVPSVIQAKQILNKLLIKQ